MATNLEEKAQSATNTASSLLRTAVGVSPLIAAAYMGGLKLKANEAINVPVAKSTPLRALGLATGQAAQAVSVKEKLHAEKQAKEALSKLRIDLEKTDSIQEIFKSNERRMGLLQSLAVMLDDPALAIEDNKRMMMKQQLMEAAHVSTPDHEKLVTDILRTMSDTNDGTLVAKFRGLQKQFTEVGAQLAAPDVAIPSRGVAYAPILSSALPRTERNYVNQIQRALGGDYRVEVKAYEEFGQTFRVAQVFAGGEKGKYLTTLPLNNLGYYRSGASGRTLYSMHRRMGNIQSLLRMAEGGKAAKDLVPQLEKMPGYFVSELVRRAQSGYVDFADLNSWMRSHMTGVDRVAGGGIGSSYGTHVKIQADLKAATVGLYGFEKLNADQQSKAVATLASKYPTLFDPGVGNKRLLARSEEGLTGALGIRANSLISRLQQSYGGFVNRNTLPLTAREHQIAGRPGLFSGPAYSINNLPGGSIWNLVSGAGDEKAIIESLRSVSPLGEFASGGLGSVMVLDVKAGGRILEGLGGSGQAYTGVARQTTTFQQYGILDPASHNYLTSDLLKKIQAGGAAGYTLSKEELRAGVYLGETAAGSRYLPFNERMQSMTLRMAEVTEDNVGGGAKRMLSLVAETTSEMDSFKYFGLLHKGNVGVRENVLQSLEKPRQDMVRRVLGHIGADERQAMYVASDMLSKSEFGPMHAIAGSARLFSGNSITLKDLEARASSIGLRQHKIFAAGSQYEALGNYAQAAMELMHARNIDPEMIGITLTGVYHGAEGKGTKSYGLNQSAINTLAKNLWGNDPAKLAAFQRGVESGVMVTYDIGTLGGSVGEYGRGRAGVEPRFAKTLQERFMGIGLTMDESSNLVAGLYKNRVGLSQNFALASHLMEMETYLSGASSAASYMKNREIQRVDLNELVKMLSTNGKEDMSLSALMRKTKGGLILDLTKGDPRMANMAKNIFGQGEIFLPGAEAFEAAKGTAIKQMGGRDVIVESELGQLMDSLQSRLLAAKTATTPDALASLKTWRGQAQDLFYRVHSELGGGKIKGGISPTAELYDLTRGVGFSNQKMFKRALDVTLKTEGQAVFQTAEGFLSQLADMQGTMSDKDLAQKARMFFTSMEKGQMKGRYLGLIGAGGRHPMMTTGNVFMTQTFRHVEEVTALGGQDVFFERMKRSEAGQKLLQSSFGTLDVKSFGHMSTFSSSQQRQFFKGFVENINKFTSGQSSDLLYVPMMKTSHGNLGIGVQAFLDNDGDHSIQFLFDGPTANRLNKQLRANRDSMALSDFRLRGFFDVMSGQAKEALSNMQARPRPASDRVYQDVLKEVGTSVQTGSLDVALRPLHEAFLAYEQDPVQKGFARLFLGNLQENFVLKGKKLPTYEYLAEQLSAATNQFTKTGDITDLRVLLNSLFEGTAIASKEGVKWSGTVSASPTVDSATAAEVNNFFRDKDIGGQYSLEEFLTRAQEVVRKGLAEGSLDKTTGQWKKSAAEDAFETVVNLRAGRSYSSAMMEGYAGSSMGAKTEAAVSSLREGFAKVDSHMTGRLALAALASAGLFGMMSGGVSPEPIIMPGEVPSGAVLGGIASGNLFNRRDAEVSPEQMVAPGNQYDRMVPINTGTAYATRPNSYQIRGEVGSGAGLATFGSYFNQLTGGSGRGVITINDQRRPITRNYVDRLLGEY